MGEQQEKMNSATKQFFQVVVLESQMYFLCSIPFLSFLRALRSQCKVSTGFSRLLFDQSQLTQNRLNLSLSLLATPPSAFSSLFGIVHEY